MFEKEAEEVTNKKLCANMMCYNHCSFNSPKHHRCGQWHKCYEIAKECMDFGFNKANEWHYVKDEGTPKVEGHYLVCLRNKDRDVFDCWIYYDKDVGWYSMKVRMKDIYAWEEIVLPKESENGKERT